MLDKKTHVHTLILNSKNKDVYRCAHPECTYFARADFIVGNKILCSKCHEPTIATKMQLITYKVRNPTCLKCSKSKKGKQVKIIENALEDIFANENLINDDLTKETKEMVK